MGLLMSPLLSCWERHEALAAPGQIRLLAAIVFLSLFSCKESFTEILPTSEAPSYHSNLSNFYTYSQIGTEIIYIDNSKSNW